MVLGYNKKKEKRERFVSLATARHNANIERVVYSNPKIAKRLFWVGLVLPDFKISWGVLLVYVCYKYPLSFRVILKHKYRDVRGFVYSVLLRRGYV